MSSAELHVRNVSGRYPCRGKFRSRNIQAQVTEVARVFVIRLDDAEHPDAWFEITVEVEMHDGPVSGLGASGFVFDAAS